MNENLHRHIHGSVTIVELLCCVFVVVVNDDPHECCTQVLFLHISKSKTKMLVLNASTPPTPKTVSQLVKGHLPGASRQCTKYKKTMLQTISLVQLHVKT